MKNSIIISPLDNVAVALTPLKEGEAVAACGILAAQAVAPGQKIALRDIKKGCAVIKYGCPIGRASTDIKAGEWVHVHNLQTGLSEQGEYPYLPVDCALVPETPETFEGFLRADGRAGIRNEIWIIPTVGCVNTVCRRLAAVAQPFGSVDGVYAFEHPYGCSQMGEDHAATRKLLAALCRHPNASGVLVVSLGCENNTLEGFQAELGEWDSERVKFMVCQEESDEIAAGQALLAELLQAVCADTRVPLPVSKLVVGMKCGASDGLSGITANPLAGRFSDMLIARGGSTVLTEVPEMFGAETLLLNRCESEAVFNKAVAMIDSFKHYFLSHGQVVYENPSPGNKAGGISTLEDKSLGCVQKGGTAPIVDVIAYGESVKRNGLTLLSGPGNDLVSATALTAAGAQLIFFTTGRGTPFGAPAPTVKISANGALFLKKPGWLDFNAGSMVDEESPQDAAERLFAYTLALADGRLRTKSEQCGAREIAIFKGGVTL